jgi:hypothetical protein
MPATERMERSNWARRAVHLCVAVGLQGPPQVRVLCVPRTPSVLMVTESPNVSDDGRAVMLLPTLFTSSFKSKSRLEAENAALRHQLTVLKRKVRGRVQLIQRRPTPPRSACCWCQLKHSPAKEDFRCVCWRRWILSSGSRHLPVRHVMAYHLVIRFEQRRLVR